MRNNKFVKLSEDELIIANGGAEICYPEPSPTGGFEKIIVDNFVKTVETIVKTCKKKHP